MLHAPFMGWMGFFFAIVVLLIVARKSLPLAMFSGAVTLGIFTLQPVQLVKEVFLTVTDLSIVFLAIAMGIIPMIGGVMKESGEINSIVNNFRVGKKSFLALAPALMGMLPVPGGAILSAPLVEKAGVGIDDRTKVSINIWFRHLFILIYPLSPALIASTKIIGLTVYDVILWLIPEFILASIVGYLFFLRKVEGRIDYNTPFSLRNLLMPLCVIVSAPVLDFVLRSIFVLQIKEGATLIAVTVAFILSIIFSPIRIDLKKVLIKSKPWNFSLIIIGMFTFLNVFIASDTASLVASLSLSGTILCVLAGFLLGFFTGRVQLPASIILPVYVATYGMMSPLVFSLTYFSIFWGYIISPTHPCIIVTLQYFNTEMKEFYKRIITPAAVVFLIILIVSIFLV